MLIGLFVIGLLLGVAGGVAINRAAIRHREAQKVSPPFPTPNFDAIRHPHADFEMLLTDAEYRLVCEIEGDKSA